MVKGKIGIYISLASVFKYICSEDLARVAKLVDALSSGGSIRKDVLVRIQSRALLYILKALLVLTFWLFLFLRFRSNDMARFNSSQNKNSF